MTPRARSAARPRAERGARRGPSRAPHQPLAPEPGQGQRHGKVPRRRLLRDRGAPDRRAADDPRHRPRLGGGEVPPHRQPSTTATAPSRWSSRQSWARWACSAPRSRATAAPGLDNVAYGLIMQELERGDSGLRSFASVQSGLVMYPIYTYGSDAQKDRWLPRCQSGDALGCFGLTEPDHGSDPGAMKTRARRRRATSYVLNGTKLWITNGSIADVAVVWAKGDDGEIGGYLVEKGTPGFSDAWTSTGSSRCAPPSPRSWPSRTAASRSRTSCPSVKGLKGPLVLPLPGALRHRLGRDRRRHGLLRLGAPVRAAAHPVRQADRLLPARAAEARVDDHRDHQGPAPVPPARPAQGRGHACGRSRSRWPR